MIGLSLSFCVRDILREKVAEQDVERIIAGTRCKDTSSFENVLEDYRIAYWNEDFTAIAIARRLYLAGKIDQPRLRNEKSYEVWKGHWVKDEAELATWPRMK